MSMRFSSMLLLWVCLIQVVSAAERIGFRETTLGETSSRPLHVSIWYPTQQTKTAEQVGENPVFVGISAIKNARVDTDSRPLVVLSHGYQGSWRNLNWLAAALVAQGYIVAAPNHPGTTTLDLTPAQAEHLWERPKDISRVIDAMLATPSLAGHVDATRIAVIGHSLGGWTVAELAGARFNTAQFVRDCQQQTDSRMCQLSTGLGINKSPSFAHQLDADWRDKRVKAVVSLDLGFARGFTPQSLAAIKIPVLVLGAGVNIADLSVAQESGYFAMGLPTATSHYDVLADASHFSFMQLCKPGGGALIEQHAPGEGIVCQDGHGRDRSALHDVISAQIIAFLAQAVPSL